jgi:hypothetical protein
MLRSLNLKYSNDRFVFTVADEQKQHEFKVRTCCIYMLMKNSGWGSDLIA